jgi:hypothetical protein
MNAGEVSPTTFSAFAGNVEEVRNKLLHVKDSQVVAVVFDESNPHEARLIQQVLLQIIRLTQKSLASHNENTLSIIVETLLPKDSPSPTLLMEAEMMLRAKVAVLESADWLTAAQVASIAGFSDKNPSAQLHKWKRDGAIFAIRRNGIDYFPGYTLDPHQEYRPYRALKKVIAHLAGAKEGWGLAFWFQSVNSFLGGKRPMDLLANKPDEVIAAAADESMGAIHA